MTTALLDMLQNMLYNSPDHDRQIAKHRRVVFFPTSCQRELTMGQKVRRQLLDKQTSRRLLHKHCVI